MPPPRPPSPAIPELTRRRAEQILAQLCDKRVPPHVRDRVRLAVAVRGNTITLTEERAPWRDDPGAEWTSSHVAQFRYHASSQQWSLYWADRNGRWRPFGEAPPTADIAQLAHALDLDTTGTFWG